MGLFERPVLMKLRRPSDRRSGERFRDLPEGRKGLARELGCEKPAPWIYLVPRKKLPELVRRLNKHGYFELALSLHPLAKFSLATY